MVADVLSHLLITVRPTGATSFYVAAREPWVAEQPPREMILPKILPGADRLIAWRILFIAGIIPRIDIGNRKRSLSVNLNHGFARRPSIMVHLRRCFGKAARA